MWYFTLKLSEALFKVQLVQLRLIKQLVKLLVGYEL